jgi:hypothetical protein
MEKTSYEKSKASVEDIIAEYFANKKKGINVSLALDRNVRQMKRSK